MNNGKLILKFSRKTLVLGSTDVVIGSNAKVLYVNSNELVI